MSAFFVNFAQMLDSIGQFVINIAEVLCGYPLFFLLIGGGFYLFLSSGAGLLGRLSGAGAELPR